MGSDVSRFHVSLIVQGKVATMSINYTTIFEVKDESNRRVEPGFFRLPIERLTINLVKPAHTHTLNTHILSLSLSGLVSLLYDSFNKSGPFLSGSLYSCICVRFDSRDNTPNY